MAPGTTIAGRYVIQGLIGKGGMSTVYEAQHVQIGKRVAVKFLSKVQGESSAAMKRFQREAKIAGTIGHHNICEVFDFGTTEDGVPFLVMELLDGESLAELLRRERSLSAGSALNIMLQVLDALDEVHSRGIIHRDLKPGNIFIANIRGHGQVVKLLDFGISKITSTAFSTSLTQDGTALGTPTYMSPEQIREARNIDHRSDIYSCGVILYKMLTGNAPYRGTTIAELIVKIMEEPTPDITQEQPDLPPALAAAVQKSIEKDPGVRFQSAAEFKDALIVVTESLPAAFRPRRPVTLVEDGGEAVAKGGSKAGWIVAVVLGLILIAGAGIAGIMVYSNNRSKQPAAEIEIKKVPITVPVRPSGTEGSGLEAPETADGKASSMVTIEFGNIPSDTRIEHNGVLHVGKIMHIEKSDDPVVLTLVAEGFKEKKVEVIPSDDRVIEVRMDPLEEGAGGARKKKKSKKKSPGGSEEAGDRGDIDHNWDYPGDLDPNF